MKNIIFNNYNISVKRIYIKNNQKYFFYNNTKIYIICNKNYNNIDELFNTSNRLYDMGIKVNTFILNTMGKSYTKYKNGYISLLKVNNFEEYIDLEDIKKFEDIINNIPEYDILKDWKDNIDYLEKNIIEYDDEYPTIQKSINFYIGIGENAIQILEKYNSQISRNNNSIGHLVTYKIFSDGELYNPFSFIKTNRTYDLSNYIKYKFLNNDINYSEIDFILNNLIFNGYEAVFFFSNILYPNIYFDLLKRIIDNQVDESLLEKYLKYRNNYRKLVVYIKKYLEEKDDEIKKLKWLYD